MNHINEIYNWALGTVLYFIKSAWAGETDIPQYPDLTNNHHNDHQIHSNNINHDNNDEYDDGTDNDEAEDNDDSGQFSNSGNDKEFDHRLLINKTRPESCDTEMWLYTLVHYTEKNRTNSGYNKTMTTNCTR